MEKNSYHKPKVSVGLPAYNSEKLISNRLESILSQTLRDIEVIISDDASTDSTQAICEEYSKKDKRIRYIRQKKNLGLQGNFHFLLKEAKCDYFVWAAHDDLWHPTFLKKNIDVLESNKNFVGSISRIQYDTVIKTSKSRLKNFLMKLMRKITYRQKFEEIRPILGSYGNKVRYYFTNPMSVGSILYGVYRTKSLRQAFVTGPFQADDWATNLEILKHGDFNVVEEDLMFRTIHGMSSTGVIFMSRKFNSRFVDYIFPLLPFFSWCRKNLGWKILLRNLDYVFLINYSYLCTQLKEILMPDRNRKKNQYHNNFLISSTDLPQLKE